MGKSSWFPDQEDGSVIWEGRGAQGAILSESSDGRLQASLSL